MMPYLFSESVIHQRIVKGKFSASDKRWLKELNFLFEEVDIELLAKSGMGMENARAFYGTLALLQRFEIEND